MEIEQHPVCQNLLNEGYKVEAIHRYTDKDGNIIFLKIRLKNPDTKEKRIRPLYHNNSLWIWGEPKFFNDLKPIYNLSIVSSNPKAKIWICEGEWAADQLNKFFQRLKVYKLNIATTSGASTSANKADWSPLVGREIVLWPDNDLAGYSYAKDVANILATLNCNIQVIDVAKLNLPKAGDAVDWLVQKADACFDDINNLPTINPEVEPSKKENKPLINFLMSADELVELNLPELDYVVYPFITVQSLIMIFAKRDIGKTWFTLELAISISLGKSFFLWDVPKARRVLFIDGEMPLASLQYRIKNLCRDECPQLLDILPSEHLWRNGLSLNLNDEFDLQKIDDFLDDLKSSNRAPEIIIIDNLSSMTAGLDENGNSDMDTMLHWLLKLRSQGYAVVVIHHAGKNGDQRGGSRREDFLDTSIKLIEAEKSIRNPEAGAAFNIEFVKLRGIRPAPDSLKVELIQNEKGYLEWLSEGSEVFPAYYETLRIIRDCKPKSQAEISKILKISASAVSQQLKTAKNKGLLEKDNLSLTKEGKVKIDKYYPDLSQFL
ncbi:AAA family ATPase [Nitrosomonas communis]|uniref:AAA family ATPase n=1 Tax=Nitrosomonas communis TaxID=44574 RepID=UPI0015A5EBC4|nr:AAA family ATPase [Nitrosomonas communis]